MCLRNTTCPEVARPPRPAPDALSITVRPPLTRTDRYLELVRGELGLGPGLRPPTH